MSMNLNEFWKRRKMAITNGLRDASDRLNDFIDHTERGAPLTVADCQLARRDVDRLRDHRGAWLLGGALFGSLVTAFALGAIVIVGLMGP